MRVGKGKSGIHGKSIKGFRSSGSRATERVRICGWIVPTHHGRSGNRNYHATPKVVIFHPAPDNLDEQWFHRLKSENGLISMAIYPVMFGYRIRAWRTGSFCCDLDWCGGDDWKQVEWLYAACRAILESRGEAEDFFRGIPSSSRIKPCWMDARFMQELGRIIIRGKLSFEPGELEKPKMQLMGELLTTQHG